jgi:predicted nuclease with TOPRIM domain
MRIATHPEAIKHLVKIGMASDISEHIKMVESANESLIKEKDELRSVAEDNKRECEATRIENARLKVEVDHLRDCLGDAHAHNAREELEIWKRIEGLKAEVERLRASSFVTAVPVEQYERLRKAGDAMADELIQEYGREVCLKFGWFKGWNAAKEGKQS